MENKIETKIDTDKDNPFIQSTVMIGLVAFSLLVAFFFGFGDTTEVMLVVILGILAFFIYGTKKWAILTTEVIITFTLIRVLAVILSDADYIASGGYKTLIIIIVAFYFIIRALIRASKKTS